MFLVEKYLTDRKRKIAEYERAKEIWLQNRSYAYADDYERNHKYPVIKVSTAMQGLGIFMGVSILCVFFFSLAAGVSAENDRLGNAVKEGATCRMFNLNDHVLVKSGDYKDLSGVIIGGCEKGQKYEIKIDAGQKKDMDWDNIEEAVDVGGKNTSIWSYEDLIVIK